MNKIIFSILLGCSALAAQPGTDIHAVRAIRLQNMKQDFVGSTIRFIGPGSISVMGVLEDVTDQSLIISHNNSPVTYSHTEIDYIFIDPGFTDLLMAFGVGLLGGTASYMAVIISKDNPNASVKGVVSSAGTVLAGLAGLKSFYKPMKIDISGKTRE
tara:strand:- start:517 stop:987 length:471 start_codon:yes stop_codon:yes gene_type:complete